MRKFFRNIKQTIERMKEMMAMLFACRIVEGRMTFSQVPAKLKDAVAEVLTNDFGLPELVTE